MDGTIAGRIAETKTDRSPLVTLQDFLDLLRNGILDFRHICLVDCAEADFGYICVGRGMGVAGCDDQICVIQPPGATIEDAPAHSRTGEEPIQGDDDQ